MSKMSKMNNRVGDDGKDKQNDYDMHIIQADSLDDALQMLVKVLGADHTADKVSTTMKNNRGKIFTKDFQNVISTAVSTALKQNNLSVTPLLKQVMVVSTAMSELKMTAAQTIFLLAFLLERTVGVIMAKAEQEQKQDQEKE